MKTSTHFAALMGGLAIAAAASLTAVSAQSGTYGYRLGAPDRLSGTYELDRAKSDNPETVVNQLTRTLPPGERDRVYRSLIGRLDSPETLAIDLNGRTVTIMSPNAPRLTFDVDGRDRSEPGPDGPMVLTHMDLYGDELTVTTSGNRGSDYVARFAPIPGGLLVTRRIDSDYQRTSAIVQSVYRRVGDQPQWNVYGSGRGVLVADGTQLITRLDRDLSTRSARDGERFTVTVTGPGPYRGAVINGVILRSGGRNGRADMVFDFDRIRLSNGRSGNFEGEIEAVRTPEGSTIRVDRSGVVRDRNHGDVSVQDTAVGAGLGAIIGAVLGGGKGAAIGAVVGGAGTIIVEGRDDLTLPAGTQLTIVAFGPLPAGGR